MSKDTEKQWIYKSPYDQTFVIKATSRQGIYDNMGNLISWISMKPIKLVFNSGYCMIDEAFANDHDVDIETIVKMISKNNSFGKGFHLVKSPAKEAPKNLETDMKSSKKKAKIVQGARS